MAARKSRPTRGGGRQGPPGGSDAPRGERGRKPAGGRPAAGAPKRQGRGKPQTMRAIPTAGDARTVAMRQQNAIANRLDGADAVKKLDTTAKVTVTVPDLSGISVQVQAPNPPDEATIDLRIAELTRAYAPFKTREPGEPIAEGDEILVDAVGYVQGDLFSSQMDEWLRVEPNPLLPGLFENLVGTMTGTHTVVPLTLPENYPDPELAGLQAAFAVDVKAANARAGEVEERVLLDELGYGETEEQQRAAIRQEIEEALALDLVAQARERVLDILQERAPGEVPQALLEAELQREYRTEQGEHLAKAGVSIEDQNAVFKAYTEDAQRIAAARRRLWEVAFLDALIDHFGVEEDKEELLKLMSKLASAAGLTAASVHTAVTSQDDQEAELVHNLRRSRAVERLLEQVDVTFVPADD